MKKYYTQLDSLRGFAVLGVLVAHWVHFRPVMSLAAGNFGVNLFFVISGFLITEILYNDIDGGKTNSYILKKFYWRRALRIFPIYYLICFITYAANFMDARDLFVYNIFYVTNFHDWLGLGGEKTAFVHIWSLCVEEQFYLLWPAIILFTRNKKLNTIIVMIAFAILVRFIAWWIHADNYNVFAYRMTPSCFDSFGIGALLAYTKKYKPEWLRAILSYRIVPIIFASIYLWYCYIFTNDFLGTVFYRFIVSVISFYLIGYAVFEVKKKNFLLNIPLIRHIGIVSYGVYLYHMFIQLALEEHVTSFLESLSFVQSTLLKYNLYLLKFPIYTAITVVVATLSYRLFEKQIMKYKSRFA